MNVWIKVGLPIILGGVAAAINWTVLQNELQPSDYVKVTKDIKAGELFTKEKLVKLSIRTEDGPGSLETAAVKWNERAILFNSPCVRDLKANDVVFWRDAPSARKEVILKKGELALQISLENVKYEPSLLLVGNQIGFVIDQHGPASSDPLLEKGPNIKAVATLRSYVVQGPFRIVSVGRRVNPLSEGEASEATGSRVISIAVKTVRDEKTGDEAFDEQANRLIQLRKNGIEAVVLYPAKD